MSKEEARDQFREDIVKILSEDITTGSLSDTPFVRAEWDKDALALFETEDESAWPTATLDVNQLVDALISLNYGKIIDTGEMLGQMSDILADAVDKENGRNSV